MGIGTVVIDGHTYGITGLRLHAGQLKISAVPRGPVRPCQNVPATVFGDDGTGICQSWNVTITPAEAAMSGSPRSTLTVVLPIQIAVLETDP